MIITPPQPCLKGSERAKRHFGTDSTDAAFHTVPNTFDRWTKFLSSLAALIVGRSWTISLWALLLANQAIGNDQASVGAAAGTRSPASETGSGTWLLSANAFAYFVPEGRDFVQPTITADRGWLHLEARYNYEDLETGSAWLGWNFHWRDKLLAEATPMVGGVFGETTGVSWGYRLSLRWWRLEIYSEGEYFHDMGNSSNDFFYNWSELTVSPVKWLRVGVVEQRTTLTERDIQPGFLVALSYRKVSLTTCVFDPDASRPTLVVGAGVQF